jgi:hypothetical protein
VGVEVGFGLVGGLEFVDGGGGVLLLEGGCHAVEDELVVVDDADLHGAVWAVVWALF